MQNDEHREDDTQTNVEEQTDESTEETSESTDWEAEAKKWKAIAERKAKKAEQAQQSERVTSTGDANIPQKEVERLTLKVDGYNDDEIEKIMELGGVKSLSNPLVKKAVDVMREERQAENAQIDTDGAMSDFSRKYSEADLRKMSTEELEKILPKV